MANVYHTWEDDWNDVVRLVIFQDQELKQAMAIPENEIENIQAFRDKYFVNDPMSDVLLTNEKVRICYYHDNSFEINNHVKRRLVRFDIYVHRSAQFNVDPVDRLKQRQRVIARRLRDLLTGTEYVCGLRFQYEDDYDLPTKIAGYVRYHIYFSYKTTH